MQLGKSSTLPQQFSQQISSQLQRQNQAFSQIPTVDLMQHYFGTINLQKKDIKRSQNLSLGSQSVKHANSSLRIENLNNQKPDNQKHSLSIQLAQNQSKIQPSYSLVQQNQTNQFKAPLQKTTRTSLSPIDQKIIKQKSSSALLQRQKFQTKKGNSNSISSQNGQTTNQKQTVSLIHSNNQDGSIFVNKENIHSNIINSLSQQSINGKSNTLPKKIALINHPKSARQTSCISNQNMQVVSEEENTKQKCNTMKDKSEMNQFIAQLASKLNQKDSNSIQLLAENLNKQQAYTDRAKSFLENNDTFTKQILQRISTQANQLSTEANSLPYSSADKSSVNTRVNTLNDDDDLTDQNNFYPCQTHPNKKAKYIASFNSERSTICSRCAIELATKGYKIEEIVKETTQNKMKQEMQHLLNIILQKKPEHENIMDRMIHKREQLFQFYTKSASLVENTFLKIERELIERKNWVLSEINKLKIENENTYTRLNSEAKEIFSELNQISSDILVHHDSILQSIELDSFNAIMENYKQKIQIINEYFADLQQQTIPLMKVSTESNENQIQKIFQVQQYQTTLIKKNSKLFNNQVNNQLNEVNDLKKELPLQSNKSLYQNISIEPSYASQEFNQEEDKTQVQQSQIYQRIGISQLLKLQQNQQNEQITSSKQINEDNFQQIIEENQIQNQKNTIQQTNLNNNESQSICNFANTSDKFCYLTNSILPISQTSSIMVKSISNLANQLKNYNQNQQFSQIVQSNQIKTSEEQEEDLYKSPDLYNKNKRDQLKYYSRQSVNDTPIAGLNAQNIKQINCQNQLQIQQNQLSNQQNQTLNQSNQLQNQQNQVQHQQNLKLLNQQNQLQNQLLNQQNQIQNQNIQTRQFQNEILNNQIRNQSQNSLNQNDQNNINQLHQIQNQINSTTSKESKSKNFNFYQLNQADFQPLPEQNQVNEINHNNFDSQISLIVKNSQTNSQKQQTGAFRTLFSQQDAQINEEPVSATKSSGNEKYKNILEKIHANQARNNTFYSDIIKNGSVSPQLQTNSSPYGSNLITKEQKNNDYLNSVDVSQFTLQGGESKLMAAFIKEQQQSQLQEDLDEQQTFGEQVFKNQENQNTQYELDSNNFTVNNSFNDEADQNKEYNSTSKFADISNGFNNQTNSMIYTPKQQQQQQQQYFQHEIQQIYLSNLNPNANNKHTDSFTHCIQNHENLQKQKNENRSSIQSNSQFSQLQVVQKSYSQMCGALQTRESFQNNSFYNQENSYDQKENQQRSFQQQQFLFQKGCDVQNQISNEQNSNQFQIENNYSINYQAQDYQQNNHQLPSQITDNRQSISQGSQIYSSNSQPILINQIGVNGSKNLKACRDFINFIESKIGEENINLTERSKNKSDFRKNLFFSPKFNTNQEDQKIEDGSLEHLSTNQDFTKENNNITHQSDEYQSYNQIFSDHNNHQIYQKYVSQSNQQNQQEANFNEAENSLLD
ncbi:hypothetical protein TTHERM_00666350 (macronuclear) [Tetrahymena thermophila SB210]|uniref:Uncharacterized protein n=1 Tax=Tetrahymena thermophila (strain SB210) TaxID=312017 RepID=Q23TE7_TETTS|nr:hypothetical protein TTHERM_00666350 [Tetrahymena thermophila SB210]EAR99759.1 hypothetical protein TTHERM_00666350 [Tetrahymena thermophila SB210]|eukprot:XP_001020004.1 hypothetical protein TTHERM_00666350 [Tetrahymena thermophila SB210]